MPRINLRPLFLPVDALTWTFVDLILYMIPVLLRDFCVVYVVTVVMRFGEVFLIHLKVRGQVVRALVAGCAFILIYKNDLLFHKYSRCSNCCLPSQPLELLVVEWDEMAVLPSASLPFFYDIRRSRTSASGLQMTGRPRQSAKNEKGPRIESLQSKKYCGSFQTTLLRDLQEKKGPGSFLHSDP